MQETKYCKDCKHYVQFTTIYPERHRCFHPILGINPVTGEIKHISADSHRNFRYGDRNKVCGPDASLFEQKAKPRKWYQIWKSE